MLGGGVSVLWWHSPSNPYMGVSFPPVTWPHFHHYRAPPFGLWLLIWLQSLF